MTRVKTPHNAWHTERAPEIGVTKHSGLPKTGLGNLCPALSVSAALTTGKGSGLGG